MKRFNIPLSERDKKEIREINSAPTDYQIGQWIDEHQRGRSIYPYRVAVEVAMRFQLPIQIATKHVLRHIHAEMAMEVSENDEK